MQLRDVIPVRQSHDGPTPTCGPRRTQHGARGTRDGTPSAHVRTHARICASMPGTARLRPCPSNGHDARMRGRGRHAPRPDASRDGPVRNATTARARTRCIRSPADAYPHSPMTRTSRHEAGCNRSQGPRSAQARPAMSRQSWHGIPTSRGRPARSEMRAHTSKIKEDQEWHQAMSHRKTESRTPAPPR